MEPRKDESKAKKFEGLPRDFCQLAEVTFLENFTTALKGKSLKLSGRIYPSEIIVRLSLGKPKEVRADNINVSVDHDKEKNDAMDQIHLAVDILATSLQEFLDKEDEEGLEKPKEWHAFQVENQEVFIMFDSLNDELEAKADELLGEDFDPEAIDEEELGAEFFNKGNSDDNGSVH